MIEGYKIYKREYDLTIYDEEKLSKYELNKAKYIYVGFTKELLVDRCSKWKYEVRHNRNANKQIIEFINNLERFYMNETDYKANVIDYLLFFNASVIDVANNEAQAKAKEKIYTGHYHSSAFFGEVLDPHYILLSSKDSSYKTIEKGGIRTLIAK